jgi:hypothetical protein
LGLFFSSNPSGNEKIERQRAFVDRIPDGYIFEASFNSLFDPIGTGSLKLLYIIIDELLDLFKAIHISSHF